MPAPEKELDVSKASLAGELKRRLPWMLFSVIAGIGMIWIARAYEAELSERIQLVFFVPVIVYMSDNIGTETLALFVRELSKGDVPIGRILLKESVVGLALGVASGVPMGLLGYALFGDAALSVTVAAAMSVNGVLAVLIGMLAPVTFAKLGRDPALGTDEIATALSDNLSMLVYLLVASAILFS
jgi:magnesium transporter